MWTQGLSLLGIITLLFCYADMHICPLTSALLPAGRAAFSHKKNKPYLPVGFPQAKAAKKSGLFDSIYLYNYSYC